MSEYDDDMQQARAFLLSDPKETANRAAEMAKRRKAAKEYVDAAAGPVEAVHFHTAYCIGCDVPLTSQNHTHNLICTRCQTESDAIIARARAANERHKAKLAKGVDGMWIVLAYVAVAIGAAAALGWAVGMLAWQIGMRS